MQSIFYSAFWKLYGAIYHTLWGCRWTSFSVWWPELFEDFIDFDFEFCKSLLSKWVWQVAFRSKDHSLGATITSRYGRLSPSLCLFSYTSVSIQFFKATVSNFISHNINDDKFQWAFIEWLNSFSIGFCYSFFICRSRSLHLHWNMSF